jgi:hypothetical protein
LFFVYLTFYCNINIHHIHICSGRLYLSNRLNLCYCHRFPMKHLMHFSNLRTSFYVQSNHKCGKHMNMSSMVFG